MSWLRNLFGRGENRETDEAEETDSIAPRRTDGGLFADDWAPEPDELVTWAMSETPAPSPDFALAVYDRIDPPFMADMVEDERSRKREFFLDCLYRRVQDCFRGGGNRVDQRVEASNVLKSVPERFVVPGQVASESTERSVGERLLDQWREDSLQLMRGEVAWSEAWHELSAQRFREIAGS